MSSIEALKEAARAHEQKDEWDKALRVYKQAIDGLEKQGAPDIALYNRVADLLVRQGNVADAILSYEKAIDLYVEAELPNNAIGVCKKIVRNTPMRHTVFLRMGQIRAKQGLLADARQNFLTYAERMQAEGNVDEGLRALGELADLIPEDGEIRLAVAGQMKAHGRTDDAIAQLRHGYHAAAAKGASTGSFEAMLQELGAEPGQAPASSAEDGAVGGLDDISMSPMALEEPAQSEIPRSAEKGQPTEDIALPTFDFESDQGVAMPMLGGLEEDSTPLPLLDSDEGEGGSESDEDAPLPMLELGDHEDVAVYSSTFDESDENPHGQASDRPAQVERAMEESQSERRGAPSTPAAPGRSGSSALPPRPAPPGDPRVIADPMGHASLAARGDLAGAMTALRKLVDASPDNVPLLRKMVEYASQQGESTALVAAWLDLAHALEHLGQSVGAKAVYEQVLTVDPQNAHALHGLGRGPKPESRVSAKGAGGDFVDLGALLMDDEEEKTTRFVVAFEEPSGDEHADFARMLSQFKAKVAENLSSDDVRAHHDLGTAYKEMGLLDEAIAEFQQALRGSADHLPTFELLGQCFLEKGEPEAAARTLKRALEAPHEIEDELIGIYYWLGRAEERLGNTREAVEFYDRVFSLDINFADVTERLRALR